MSKITIDEKRTLADLLALPAGAELDAAVANALGDDLSAFAKCQNPTGRLKLALVSAIEPTARAMAFDRFLVKGCETVFDGKAAQGRDNGERAFWLWQNRTGLDYAPALEAAVAVYRRPAPKYSTSATAMFDLFVQMKERGFNRTNLSDCDRRSDYHETVRFEKNGRGTFCHSETLPLAVARAAITALQYGSEP